MRCVALLSGGLDASLAVRLVQRQGIEVHALTVTSPLTPDAQAAATAANQLNVPLTIVEDRGYAPRLFAPRLGRLGLAGACLDCRVALLRAAKEHLQATDAAFVVTGEVLGQRPRTSAFDLELVAAHAGLDGQVVRPLSARRLPPTAVEARGWLNRHEFHGVLGKSRRIQRQLAAELGLTPLPPRPDCPLLAGPLAQRARHGRQCGLPATDWLLTIWRKGRLHPLTAGGQLILGKNRHDNELLRQQFWEGWQGRAELAPAELAVWLLEPVGVIGPVGLVIGRAEGNVGRMLVEAVQVLRTKLRGAASAGAIRMSGRCGVRDLPLALIDRLTPGDVCEERSCSNNDG